MKYVGAHVSAQGGVSQAPLNAMAIGANAFALFTRNQKRWVSNPYQPDEIEKFKKNLKLSGIEPEHILPHDSYLINIGSPTQETREKSLEALYDEASRVEQLGLIYLNFHPGSHLNQISEKECIALIAKGINEIHDKTESSVLVIETTAGQGSNIGYKFEHIRDIIDLTKNKARIGVCIDTCHIFAAGYGLKTKKEFEDTMARFQSLIGFDKLNGVHINDSKFGLSAKKDRHESLGHGFLGLDPFKFIMADKRFDNIPLILETIDPTKWKEEIKLLRSFIPGGE